MNLRTSIRALLATPLAWALPLAVHAAPQYTVTDLGTFGGKISQAPKINVAGDVAGYSTSTGAAELKPLLWQNGLGLQELPTLGGTHAQALNLNDAGQVVGLSFLAGDTATRGFVWTPGQAPLTLPTLGGNTGRALAINNSGVVTGASAQANGNELGFAWQDLPAPAADTFATLRSFSAAGIRSQGNDINSAGQVVGFADNGTPAAAPRNFHAALWASPYTGIPTDLGTLGGTNSEAYAINDSGQVTGYANVTGDIGHRAFLWRAGQTMVDLGRLTNTSNFSEGYDINGAGDVVGYSTTAGDGARRAIVRKASATAMADLNGLVPPNTGWVLTEAYGINETGQIVGLGTLTRTNTLANTISVERHAFLLDPDKTAPTVSCPADITTTGAQPTGLGTAVATDNLDPGPFSAANNNLTNNRPATFPTGETRVTWTATDAAGNRGTCTQLVKVGGDNTPPVIGFNFAPAAPDGLNGWYKTRPTLSWSVVDNESTITARTGCNNVSAPGIADTLGQAFNCAATSAGGPSATVAANVKVDSAAPSFMNGVPGPQTVEATSATGAAVTYPAPTATDNVSGLNASGVTCTPASGASFPMGSSTVNCSASDNAGNTASASFAVTVSDTTAPVINAVPASFKVSATSLSGAVVNYALPTATDGASGVSGAVDCSPASGTAFPMGLTTVSCSVSDAAGNRASASFTVDVADTTAPVIAATVNGTPNASGWYRTATVSWSVTDNESPITSAACDVATLGNGLGQTASCSATSAGGMATRTSSPVNVDSLAPALTGVSTGVTVTAASGATGAIATYALPTASDTLSGVAGGVNCSPASGSTFAVGTTNVTCGVSDNAGNTAERSFVVTVNAATDTTPPVITPSITGTQGANGWYISPVNVAWNVADAESAVSPPACATATLGNGAGQTVSCTASSAGGSTSRTAGPISVDTVAPSFGTCAATVTLTQGQALARPTATDNLSTPVVTGAPASLPVGTTTVTWVATDQAGHTANCVQQVTVNAAATEVINVTAAQCRRSGSLGQWNLQGTSSVTTGNSIQLFTATGAPIGSATVSGGNWRLSTRFNAPACTSTVTARSTATGTTLNGIPVSVR